MDLRLPCVTDPWAEDLALALALCDEADALSLQRFRALDLVVETKPDDTPVTDADRGVEELVRTRLAGARPDDAVLGEEYGVTGDSVRRWVLDPIDGTKSYARGVPVWATLLALTVDGEVVVGVASAPALGRRWWATRGGGAYAAEAGVARSIRVSGVSALGDASLSYSSLGGWPDRTRLLALTDAVWRTRAYGDFWSHVLVAEGVVDLSTEPAVSLWDLAPLALIVEEAGGRFTGLDGVRGPDRGSCLASNALLHEAALRTLRP
jgi:histidinol-phosphatase